MIDDTKPKISYGIVSYMFGAQMGLICKSRLCFESGKTPEEAYERWDKERPKSFLARLQAVCLDWLSDHPTFAVLLMCAIFCAIVFAIPAVLISLTG